MNQTRIQCLAATAAVLAFSSSPVFAQTDQATEEASPQRASIDFLDLTASLGYSSNPFLRIGDSKSSVFGRVSARGVHAWNTELSSSSLSAFVEGSTYFNDYGLKSIFAVNGNTSHQVSETVRVFGSAGVSGDLSGQLSNRFLYVPPVPVIPDPNVPQPPDTVDDPDLFSFSGRQYRIYGQGGAAFQVGPNSSMSISGGVQRLLYTQDLLNDYTTFFGHLSYNRALSERTTIGLAVSANQTEYDNSDDHSTIINPAFTVRTKLSEYWDASASVGVSFASIDRGMVDNESTDLSLRGSLCHTTETERLCGRVARYTQNSASNSLVTTTSLGVDWYKKLDESQTIQLSASIVRYIRDAIVDDNEHSHHFRAAASYSRRLNDRLSAGVDLGYRSLALEDSPDPDADITGSVFLRYRLGDLG